VTVKFGWAARGHGTRKNMSSEAVLALADGTVFRGRAFGAKVSVVGEVCFNTSMTGYQEILTDPSYKGQLVSMTYPLIGNYGVNSFDNESWKPHAAGFIIRELSPMVSNWRSEKSLDAWLQEHGIPGIQEIDTRSLTKKLRVRGAMPGFLSHESISDADAISQAQAWGTMEGRDYVRDVTHPEPFVWDPMDQLSDAFRLPRGPVAEGAEVSPSTPAPYRLPEADMPIVAYDLGIKYNILRRLRQRGFRVQVVPAHTTAEQALSYRPAGIFLSNGPGDPAALSPIVSEIRKLMDHGIPIFGICLGHQVLAQALGGRTFKLKFGHRGGNQPVKDIESGRVEITSQNHGFAVDPATLPDDVMVNRINLNDQTVEGLRHKSKPIFSVQYHPEASPGPHDSTGLFDEFRALLQRTS
jgi:carbamoyl-phosphate synthase small subunit